MADTINLWKGGTKSIEWVPVTGDAFDSQHSSEYVSVTWPSGYDAMGCVEPYYIMVHVGTDTTNSIRSESAVSFTFNSLPASLTSSHYIRFNVGAVIHRKGTLDTSDYIATMCINESYTKTAAFHVRSGESQTVTLPCDEMSVRLPASVDYLKISVNDLPSDVECYLAINNVELLDTEPEEEPTVEEFNAKAWMTKYVIKGEEDDGPKDDEFIANYVNWPREDVVHYDDGTFSISPLGFPGTSNGEDVESPLFVTSSVGTSYGNTEDHTESVIYRIRTNIANMTGKKVIFPALSLSAYTVDDSRKYDIIIAGDISDIPIYRVGIVSVCSDTLESTNILRDDILGTDIVMEYTESTGCTTVTIPASVNCEVETLGANIVGLAFSYVTPYYIALSAQENSSENGVYQVTDDNVSWRRTGDDTSLYESLTGFYTLAEDGVDTQGNPKYKWVQTGSNSGIPGSMSDPDQNPYANPAINESGWAWCNGDKVAHFRRNYSDREVLDYVEASVGYQTGFGVHSPVLGEQSCNGAFVQWFTSTGDIDIAPGSGNSVCVNAFGLGSVYSDTPVLPTIKNVVDEPEPEPLHPMMQWGIGTKWNADTDGGLPKDWPFTHASNYATSAMNNNITLVRQGAKIPGSDDTFGNLDYIDDDGNKVEINRHVIAIYNDLEPTEDGPDGYSDATTVLKPTFIHIPAPLSTKDGDTVELEVALENFNIDKSRFADASIESLSGYYAMMSQPRVYVVGGYQHVLAGSHKILEPTREDVATDYFDVTVDEVLHDEKGVRIPVGTALRIQLTSPEMKPTSSTFEASLAASRGSQTMIRVTGTFPYDIGGRNWKPDGLRICGITYLDAVEVGDLTPSSTPMGLVTRTPEILGVDHGTGVDGDLDQYNRFYSLNREVDGRYTFPGKDKRYLLATVYQSSTNTFPWALAGRKKLRNIARTMTTEGDNGPNAITAQAWELNKALLQYNSANRDFRAYTMLWGPDGVTPRAVIFTPEEEPMSYFSSQSVWDGESTICKRLRVTLPGTSDDKATGLSSRPIRQAERAYKALVKDYFSARAGFGDITDAYSMNNSKLDIGMTGRGAMPSAADFFAGRTCMASNVDPITTQYDPTDLGHNAFALDGVGDSMWGIKLRHVPVYVRDAFFETDTDGISTNDKDWAGFDGRFMDYLEYSDYSLSGDVITSTDSYAETTCSLVGVPNMPRRFSNRSVLDALFAREIVTVAADILDIRRYAEMQEVSIPTEMRSINKLIDGVSDQWEDIWASCTRIFSLDYVPYPEAAEMDIEGVTESQRPFVSADAVQKYVYHDEPEDSIEILSDVMPDADALTEFLVNYIPECASELPKRFYSSYRILVGNENLQETDYAYIRNVKWMNRMFSNCEHRGVDLNRYINDNFVKYDGNSADRNMGWRELEADDDIGRVLALNISAPPYTVDNTFYDSLADVEDSATYTRVYMEFTFCAKAGRWLTTGYRQYPSTYLSPLYGADTFEAKLGGSEATAKRVWTESMCSGVDRSRHVVTVMPYEMYQSMDIAKDCIPYLYNESPYDDSGKLKDEYTNECDAVETAYMSRLADAPNTVEDGGLNLYPPADVNGCDKEETHDGIHANVWSVRKYLRPAVSALHGTDIPSRESRTGGRVGDPTLTNMFDYPVPGEVSYHVPDTVDPKYTYNNAFIYKDGDAVGPIKDHTGTYLGPKV